MENTILKDLNIKGKIIEKGNRAHRKVNLFYAGYEGVGLTEKGKFINSVSVRFYSSERSISTYCSIWVTDGNMTSFHTSGKTIGYGYDQESASLADAFFNAGIETEHLDSRGGEAIEESIREILEHLGFTQYTVIHVHG